MEKEKKILYFFVYWLFTLLLVFLVGISNVFASTYNTNYELTQQYYDNRGSSLTNITTTWNESLQSYVSDNITTVANSYGAGVSLTSPIPLIKNHTYSISFYFIDRNNISLSIKNKVTVGTSLGDAKVNYAKDTYYADTIYSKVTNNSILQFVFKAGQNGNSIFIPWTTTTNVTQSYVFTEIIMEDLGSEGISQEDINNSLNNQTNILNNSIQNSVDSITGSITETEDNINQNIDDMEQSIIDSNKETQDVIKDQFNTCRDSYNLLNVPYDYSITGVRIIDMVLEPGTYTIQADEILVGGTDGRTATIFFYEGDTYTAVYLTNDIKKKSFNITEEVYRVRIYSSNNYTNSQGITTTYKGLMLAKGYYNGNYEAYGEEICSNKLDEANETSKGILGKIGDLISYINPVSENFFVYKLIDLLMELLKSLFIPEEGYFESWFNTLKVFFEEKLGFLATPFTLIIDFVNRYLSLNPQSDIVINIPDITVPNFENHIIVHSTSFNWSELLNSKDSLKLLWELYLSFVDVFLILNFINLCENKYNRIFGGDTTPYEYYTVEDSYNVDVNTGEVLNQRRNERRTVRKKVS